VWQSARLSVIVGLSGCPVCQAVRLSGLSGCPVVSDSSKSTIVEITITLYKQRKIHNSLSL
jgi:hypothetical protein